MEYQDDTIRLSVNISCPKCGSTEMRYDPELGDESPVTCNVCEESLGKLSAAKATAKSNALNQVFSGEIKKTMAGAFRIGDVIKFTPK